MGTSTGQEATRRPIPQTRRPPQDHQNAKDASGITTGPGPSSGIQLRIREHGQKAFSQVLVDTGPRPTCHPTGAHAIRDQREAEGQPESFPPRTLIQGFQNPGQKVLRACIFIHHESGPPGDTAARILKNTSEMPSCHGGIHAPTDPAQVFGCADKNCTEPPRERRLRISHVRSSAALAC